MGQAKRKHATLESVTYRTAPTILAFAYDPADCRSFGSVAISAEAIYVPRSVSIFRPDLPTTNPPEIVPAYLSELKDLHPEAGDMVVLHQDTLSISDIIPVDSFRATYDHLTWTHGFYCLKGGESVRVDQDENNNLMINGTVIDDMLGFLRNRVREIDQTRMAADQAIAMQAIQIATASLYPSFILHSNMHLRHLVAASTALRRISAASSAGACADLDFPRVLGDDGVIPDDTPPPLFPVVCFDWVSRTSATIPQTIAARAYALAVGESLTIFQTKTYDDPKVWADYAVALAKLSRIAGQPFLIGADAVRTSMEISFPNSASHLAKADVFFAGGVQLARIVISDAEMAELIDIGNARYLVITYAGNLREIVGWTITT